MILLIFNSVVLFAILNRTYLTNRLWPNITIGVIGLRRPPWLRWDRGGEVPRLLISQNIPRRIFQKKIEIGFDQKYFVKVFSNSKIFYFTPKLHWSVPFKLDFLGLSIPSIVYRFPFSSFYQFLSCSFHRFFYTSFLMLLMLYQ